MKIPREMVLVLVIIVSVAAAAQWVAPERSAAGPTLTSDSVAPDGAKALYLWLQSLGFRVGRLEHRRFRPDETMRALLILAPATRPDRDDLSALRLWVERGGTLVLAGVNPLHFPRLPVGSPTPPDSTLPAFLKEFGLDLRPLATPKAEAASFQPLLLRPAVNNVRVEATSYITGSSDLIPYLGAPERPIAAGLAFGRGQVYVLASAHAFSNSGIGQADNAALLLNWLPAPGEAGVVTFDEVHHGRIEIRSLPYDLVHEPWGWGVLYALGIVFVYILLGGRRFGRAVPSVVDARRVAAEYVISVANLLRRGGKSAWVARHYENALRRQLTITCGLDHGLNSQEVAARLGAIDRVANGVEGRAASHVLLELHYGSVHGLGEARLVHLATETDRIIKACNGRRR